jgi:predicted signal transduction protein with EAL and GGDEF domain
MSIEGLNIGIGASVGIAHAVPGDCGGDLLGKADLALYAAKDQGRGCVSEYAPGMTHKRRQKVCSKRLA